MAQWLIYYAIISILIISFCVLDVTLFRSNFGSLKLGTIKNVAKKRKFKRKIDSRPTIEAICFSIVPFSICIVVATHIFPLLGVDVTIYDHIFALVGMFIAFGLGPITYILCLIFHKKIDQYIITLKHGEKSTHKRLRWLIIQNDTPFEIRLTKTCFAIDISLALFAWIIFFFVSVGVLQYFNLPF